MRIRGKATLADLEAVVGDRVRVIGRACKARLGDEGSDDKAPSASRQGMEPRSPPRSDTGDKGLTKPGIS